MDTYFISLEDDYHVLVLLVGILFSRMKMIQFFTHKYIIVCVLKYYCSNKY